MRRNEVFWGSLLVLLGLLFLLKAMGYLVGDVFGWFWPLFIIAIGAWILVGGFIHRRDFEQSDKFSIPLGGAREAKLSIGHGMGTIELRTGADPGDFLTGAVGVGMNRSSRLNGNTLEVQIDAGPSFIPFIGPESGTWQFRLNPDVPTSLNIDAGASHLDLDLTDLRVTRFSFDGGASRLDLALPAHVENTLVEIEAGAASIDLTVPSSVAMRLHAKSIGSLHIDESRFPRGNSNYYQSVDYDTAPHRADVTVDGGATSIRVH